MSLFVVMLFVTFAEMSRRAIVLVALLVLLGIAPRIEVKHYHSIAVREHFQPLKLTYSMSPPTIQYILRFQGPYRLHFKRFEMCDDSNAENSLNFSLKEMHTERHQDLTYSGIIWLPHEVNKTIGVRNTFLFKSALFNY